MRKYLATMTLLPALLTAGPALAQDVPIQEVRILVLDPATKEVLEEVSPKGTLTLEVGATVRLRMAAIPVGQRGPRYPATRFEVVYGKARVLVTRANEEVGNITLEAIRTDNPPRPHEETLVTYEILDKMKVNNDKLLSGHITIQVVAAEEAEPAPVVEGGVMLYDQPQYRGFSETFSHSDPDLGDNPIRDNAASSIRLAPGCEAILFEGPGYSGRRAWVTEDVADLGGTDLGSRTASSLQVRCSGSGGGPRPGVTLYADDDFRGTSEKFFDDDQSLRDSRIGNDSASSVRVDPGCRATLYQDNSYRGRSFVVTGEIRSLRSTPIGNDSVSSLRVECAGD